MIAFAGITLALQYHESVQAELSATAAKPVKLPPRRRRSKYSDDVCAVCLTCWNEARRNAEVRHAVNTRTTYKAAFEYFAASLKAIGVKTVAAFKAIIHAVQSRQCEARKKALEAKRSAERGEKAKQKTAEYDIMSAMKNLGKSFIDKVRGALGLAPTFVTPSSGAAQFPNTPPPPAACSVDASQPNAGISEKINPPCSTDCVAGRLLLREGGWVRPCKHFDNTPEYAQVELDAREKRLGLWSDANPVEPHKFRKAMRNE